MRTFNYSAIKEQKWDSDVLGLIAAIYKEAGKQELYLKQRPEELEKLVDSGKFAVAFSMYPTTVGQLMAIADAGEIMPPKSTWFEPKLRSGLFVHTF